MRHTLIFFPSGSTSTPIGAPGAGYPSFVLWYISSLQLPHLHGSRKGRLSTTTFGMRLRLLVAAFPSERFARVDGESALSIISHGTFRVVKESSNTDEYLLMPDQVLFQTGYQRLQIPDRLWQKNPAEVPNKLLRVVIRHQSKVYCIC